MLQKTENSGNFSKTSKEQLQFHALLEKIQLLKKIIEEKRQLTSKFEQLKNEEVTPLVNRYSAIKLAQLRTLNWAYDRNAISKRLKIRLREEIVNRINELLSSFHFNEEQEREIMEISSHHLGLSVEEIELERKGNNEEATRDYLWEHYGIKLEEGESADLNDPEVIEKIREKIAEGKKQKNGTNTEGREAEHQNTKADAIQDKLSKSIRSVYTSLVKFLHPDKEMDETKKEFKTEAIKEVTKAYESKDMLALLILQAKYGIAEEVLDDSELRKYNTILKKQMNDLERQHASIVNTSRGIPLQNEKAIEQFLKAEKNNIKKVIKQEQNILQGIFENEDMLEQYLKQQYY